ncbi:MAG: hypothetical protein J6R79_00255 [Bacteroidaceae bacterium]|nr:hypothetical protein [Bacteroidaceae bacterium]
MTTPSVEELRNKYYAGDASLEEERLLKQLLLAPDAPEEWKQEGEMMELMSQPLEVVPPTGFERRILECLKQEPGWQDSKQYLKIHPFFKHIAFATGIAAAMAGFFFALDYYSKPTLTIYMDTCLNAGEAREEVENALLLVANTLSFDELDDDLGEPCE